MSERYMYKLTYKPTLELARKLAWLDDDPRIGKTQTILMDAIEDTSVSLDSTISTHPQLNGEAVADHMYKNPVEVNISGSFSAYGGTLIDTSGNTGNSMMQWIQNLFEAIKDFAIVCTLVKVSVDGSTSSVRFKSRKNMVLQSITWTEKLMSMSYSFKFVEIMMATVQEYSVDTSDPFLPSIDVLQSISFTQEVMNWSAVDALVIAACVQSGWIDPRIVEQASETYGVYAGLGIGAGAGTIVVLSGLAGGVASIPVAGWIAAGVIALGIAGIGIYQAIKRATEAKKFKEAQIKYYDDDVKNRESVERFNNFRSNIMKQIVRLDDAITTYAFTLISKPCEFYVNFENTYYLCSFEDTAKSYVKIPLMFTLKDIEHNVLSKAIKAEEVLPDLFMYKASMALYRLPYTGSYVYLLRKYNPVIADDGTVETWGYNIDYRNATDTFYLVASKIAPEDFSAIITNIVLDAIMR